MDFKSRFTLYLPLLLVVVFTGCAETEKLRMENLSMNQEIGELQREREDLSNKYALSEREKASLIREQNRLEDARREMEEKLRGTGATVKTKDGKISITLPSSIFFNSGQVTLKKSAKSSLTTICNVLKRDFSNEIIRIEGHTDNDPVKRTKMFYASNWELSSMRAANVLHFLVGKCSLNPKNLYIAGFGEYQPVASNKTKSGKKQNRRVEIVVLTDR